MIATGDARRAARDTRPRSTMRERMGPGGLRGLQILLSGASRVRGGFDSHAFPPLLLGLAVAVAVLGAAPGPSGAQQPLGGQTPRPTPADTVYRVVGPTPADSAARRLGLDRVNPDSLRAAAADTAARRDRRALRSPPAEPKPGLFQAPRWVMLRSAVVPGWGQAHNGAWLKAAAIAGLETYLGLGILDDHEALDDLEGVIQRAQRDSLPGLEEEAVTAYNARLNQYVRRQWFLGGLIAYALVDAYVDAHFRNFTFDAEPVPALDGGPAQLRWRAAWEWRF
jgi:hypothetical protein